MESFMNDFQVFFSAIFGCIKNFWNWLISTQLGEILVFVIIISVFLLIINLIVRFKD